MTDVTVALTMNPPSLDRYELRTVLSWDYPLMQSYGFDVSRGAGDPIGQFQVIPLYVVDSLGNWCGTWSAVSNYNKLTHSDMMNVARTQLLEHHISAFDMTDNQILNMISTVLPDGYSLKQKMGWLYQSMVAYGSPAQEMWGLGDWYKTSEGRFGTMVHGGQLVAVSTDFQFFNVQMPTRSHKEYVGMREVLTFKRSDFGKSHADFPHLVQWATSANLPNNTYGEYMRGHIAVPCPLDPVDFDFVGSFPAQKYFIPNIWLM